MKRFAVDVTDADIGRALRRHSGECMVAQAIKRANPDAGKVMVDIQTIRYTDKSTGERLCWLTPPQVQDLIVAFDAGEHSRCVAVRFTLARQFAMRLQRTVPKTPEDQTKLRAAAREGRSKAGVKTTVDAPARTKDEAGGVVVPTNKRAPRSSNGRSYGRRSLHINQARERTGDLPPEPEPIPIQSWRT